MHWCKKWNWTVWKGCLLCRDTQGSYTLNHASSVIFSLTWAGPLEQVSKSPAGLPKSLFSPCLRRSVKDTITSSASVLRNTHLAGRIPELKQTTQDLSSVWHAHKECVSCVCAVQQFNWRGLLGALKKILSLHTVQMSYFMLVSKQRTNQIQLIPR